MKKIALVSFLFLVSLSTSLAQTDWSKTLNKDLVTVKDGTLNTEDLQLLKFSNDATLQFKTSATGPQGVVSRDQFISVFSSLGTYFLISILDEAGVSIDDVDMTTLDKLTGEADIAIHMEMNKTGVELAITTSEGTEPVSMSWEDFFGKK